MNCCTSFSDVVAESDQVCAAEDEETRLYHVVIPGTFVEVHVINFY